MTSFGAILFLALVCHLSVTFGRNYKKEYGEGSLFFPHHRNDKPKTVSGVRYVRPRPLEPFDSSDALEDADIG